MAGFTVLCDNCGGVQAPTEAVFVNSFDECVLECPECDNRETFAL